MHSHAIARVSARAGPPARPPASHASQPAVGWRSQIPPTKARTIHSCETVSAHASVAAPVSTTATGVPDPVEAAAAAAAAVARGGPAPGSDLSPSPGTSLGASPLSIPPAHSFVPAAEAHQPHLQQRPTGPDQPEAATASVEPGVWRLGASLDANTSSSTSSITASAGTSDDSSCPSHSPSYSHSPGTGPSPSTVCAVTRQTEPPPAPPAATPPHANTTCTPSTTNPHPDPDSTPSGIPDPAEPPPPPDLPAVPDWLQRTGLLVGPEGVAALRRCRVVLVGLGGVGSFVAEFLARAGVGGLAIVDGDVVDVSNKNRQLPALDSTVGVPKAQVVAKRLRDINPQLNLVVRQEYLLPDGAASRLLHDVASELDRLEQQQAHRGKDQTGAAAPSDPCGCGAAAAAAGRAGDARTEAGGGVSGRGVAGNTAGGAAGGAAADPVRLDWVVDCIDSIAPKLALVAAAQRGGARVVSSMGAGGRMDPLAVRVADISETYGDAFAANVRRGLRRTHGIRDGVTVVFSTEPCRRASLALTDSGQFKRSYYGTISYLPALFGLLIAAHILNVETQGPMLASEAAQRRQLRQQTAPPGKKAARAGGGARGGGGGGGGGKAAAPRGGARSATRSGGAAADGGGAPAAVAVGCGAEATGCGGAAGEGGRGQGLGQRLGQVARQGLGGRQAPASSDAVSALSAEAVAPEEERHVGKPALGGGPWEGRFRSEAAAAGAEGVGADAQEAAVRRRSLSQAVFEGTGVEGMGI